MTTSISLCVYPNTNLSPGLKHRLKKIENLGEFAGRTTERFNQLYLYYKKPLHVRDCEAETREQRLEISSTSVTVQPQSIDEYIIVYWQKQEKKKKQCKFLQDCTSKIFLQRIQTYIYGAFCRWQKNTRWFRCVDLFMYF